MDYESWAVVNAIAVISSLFLRGFTFPFIFPLIVLTFMVVSYRDELIQNWVPNILTLLRLFAAGISIILMDVIGASLVLLIAIVSDAVDGRLARYLGMESKLGAYLDSETDAYIVLALSLKLSEVNPILLVAGVLRYLYVLAIFLSNFKIAKEEPNLVSRLIGFAVMASYLLYFAEFKFPIFYLYVIVILVSITFIKDFTNLAKVNSKVSHNGTL